MFENESTSSLNLKLCLFPKQVKFQKSPSYAHIKMVRSRGKMQDIEWRNPHGKKVDFAMKNKNNESEKMKRRHVS